MSVKKVPPHKLESDDEDVGYGKPPKSTRFKKGKSGNPRGRPKGYLNFKTDLDDALGQKIRINLAGKQIKMTRQRAMIEVLMQKALKGDIHSLKKCMELAASFGEDHEDAEERKSKSRRQDSDIIQDYMDRKYALEKQTKRGVDDE